MTLYSEKMGKKTLNQIKKKKVRTLKGRIERSMLVRKESSLRGLSERMLTAPPKRAEKVVNTLTRSSDACT